jgi:hypothetical protein
MNQEDIGRVRDALANIEAAQKLVNTAAEALCPVPGFAKEWNASAVVHGEIQTYWHRVNRRLERLLRNAEDRAKGKGCPRCGAPLPCDGSCCDECGWVRAAECVIL